ncbi:hypothetical protein N0V93_006788 [Gnomoniopsis smithogilvyi]|uniref:LysM domain-containing protein n=1 Tax=Gnomoniopsis smithogilvyi TaxID=1191159 RepID=A0A9W8YNV6_9PEZI|nr:hypothetical protein N0V93_006788 [Gnomoniopsis smithogilvyi]
MLALKLFVAVVTFLSYVSASPAFHPGTAVQNAHKRGTLSRALHARASAAPAAAAAASNGTQTVTVQAGDSLGKIAPKFGVGICDIAKASGIANPNVITPGQTLTIPAPTANPDNTSCLPPAAPPASAGCVAGGPDRLVIPTAGLSAELAAKFLNITLNSFAAANPKAFASAGNNASVEALAATNLTGSSIMTVPVCPNSQCTISQGVVKSGDIFDSIAAAAGSTTGQILALNPGIDRLNLAVGQTFTLPSKCQNLTGAATN